MSIKTNLEAINATIPDKVKLIAVSKFHGVNSLLEAYNAGQRIFGENKVQEMDAKRKMLPQDIEWHLIGHLQTNKVKTVVKFVDTIQSVDSWKLLLEIDKYAKLAGRIIKCLLEVHIAEEESKFGLSFDKCKALLDNENWKSLHNIQIAGVMGMATNTDNSGTIRNEFGSLKSFFDELKKDYFPNDPLFCEISMGMSHDYQIAIEEGATMVRIGTSIFGQREY